MTWWNQKSKPDDEPASEPVQPDPEPDMSTKPEDEVGYCSGYACPEGHVEKTLEVVTGRSDSRMVCQKCGKISKLAVVRRRAEYRWRKATRRYELFGPYSFEWGWYNSWLTGYGLAQGIGNLIWTKLEVVRFLDEGAE